MSPSRHETPSAFARIARELAETHGVIPTLDAVVRNAVLLLPCQWAIIAVTEELRDQPTRLAASTDQALATAVAAIAGAAGTSPGIASYRTGDVVVCNDLHTAMDEYPDYASGILERTKVRAVLSVPLRLHDKTLGVLSCYADHVRAFDDESVQVAQVISVHAVIAIESAQEGARADNLELALLRARTIGAAMGILIERFQITPADAFAWLSRISQHQNRKLGLVASELIETGTVAGLDATRPTPSPVAGTH